MLQKLSEYGIVYRESNGICFKLPVINSITQDFVTSLQKVQIDTIKDNIHASKQIGSNCYLVAALEMLLSSTTFLRFIQFYSQLPEAVPGSVDWTFSNIEHTIAEITKTPIPQTFCKLLIEYIAAKPTGMLDAIFSRIENLLRAESDFPVGEQDDVNVVIIYLQRSFLFSLLFSKRTPAPGENGEFMFNYGPLYMIPTAEEFYPPFVIFLVYKTQDINVQDTLESLNTTDVIAVATKTGGAAGGHYEVYQHIYRSGKKTFIAKNTMSQMAIWQFMYVLIREVEVNQIIRVLNIK